MTFKRDDLRSLVAGIAMVLVAACAERTSEDPSTDANVKAPAITAAVSAEDAEMARGKLLFVSCAICHTTNAGGFATIGPNLAGVLGSESGTKVGFGYSEALIASDIIWTEETLDQYIASPATLIPGGSMAFVGVANEKDRKAIFRYMIAKTGGDGSDPDLLSDQGDDVAAWE
jgi:cytochrome c